MNCPHCNVTLAVSERQGVEIDHCPQCRGVWLDRGELDKIVERYAAFEDRERDRDRGPRYAGDERPRYDHDRPHYQHKRKSFWQELFD